MISVNMPALLHAAAENLMGQPCDTGRLIFASSLATGIVPFPFKARPIFHHSHDAIRANEYNLHNYATTRDFLL